MRIAPTLACALPLSLLSMPALAAPAGYESAPQASPTPDVVGGTPAPEGKWNDTAAVYFGSQPGCTGTLIAPNLVLTAGHCIGGITQVELGVNDWSKSGETIPVIAEYEYPNSWQTYDIGVLVLERNSTIAPRLIASGCILERSLMAGARVSIVGYGAINDQGNQYTTQLMEAETTVNDPDCTGGRGCNGSVSPGGELAAGGDGIDSCFGDSGGPLYLHDESGPFLVGVTSRAYSDASVPCSEGGIYVRADAVMEWVESQTGVSLPRTTCNLAPEPTTEVTMLEVEAGSVVSATISPNDPDEGDSHTLSVATGAQHGELGFGDDGTVHYRAAEDYEGMDTFIVRVSDNGVPSLSGEVVFEVAVVPAEGGCGCQASSGQTGVTALLSLLAIGLVWRRRRT